MSRIRKMAVAVVAAGLMLGAMAGPAVAFHHVAIPATDCASERAGSPSNDNGQAKERLATQERGGEAAGLPLPPVGTPGAGKGQGGEHCAGA